MRRFRGLFAGLALVGLASGTVTTGALAQDTAAADLVGAWQSTGAKSLYLFEADGGYTLIRWREPVTTGTYELLSEGHRTTIRLAADAYVAFSGDGGAAIFYAAEATPAEAVASMAYGQFVHASAADPAPSAEPMAIEGSWIAQDGSAVVTFGPNGGGTFLMLDEYLDFSTGRAGTRRAIGYKFRPTPGGGVLGLALGAQRLDFEVAGFGPDVMVIDGLPADGLDPDALRSSGGEIVLVRVVDTP